MKRVVITGLGTINPLGHDVESTWAAIKRGECGIAPITLYDTTDRKVKLAAEVKNYEAEKWIDKREAKRMDRFTQFAVIAAKEAVQDAGFDMEKEELEQYYPEFEEYKENCRFHGCSHTHEPGCRIKEAVEEGNINKERYHNYLLIYEELKNKKKY